MRQHWETREGILLQATPYLENRRILKILTKDAGLILLIARVRQAPFAVPFCRAEWVYCAKQRDIHSLKEGTLLDPMLKLKESFSSLEAAGSMAQDLLRTLLPQKPSDGLYELLLASLAHLACNPQAIAQSFRLKLLQWEGLLRLQPSCIHCSAKANSLAGGESVCTLHATQVPLFNREEWELLLVLGLARRFSELASISIPPAFLEKSRNLLLNAIH